MTEILTNSGNPMTEILTNSGNPMTEILTVTNLDFEYELAAGETYQPIRIMRQVSQKWNSILRLLPGAQQAECGSPDILESPNTERLFRGEIQQLLPWGVTPRVVQLAQQHKLQQSFPEPAVVRDINDKRFSHRLEKKLKVALPYSCIVKDKEDLQAAVANCPHGWILKHPLGVSGRERVIGKPGIIIESAQRWADRKFRQGWSLVFEPWVEKRQDSSIHFTIEPEGEISLLGYCELLTDDGGTHRGNKVSPSSQPPPEVHNIGTHVAEELGRLGYWGVVGIDVLSGFLGKQPVQRPIVEINARQSFGRLTLALGQWVPQNWSYLWWHPTKKDYQQITKEYGPFPPTTRETTTPGFYILPSSVDPEGRSQTLVIIGTAHNLNPTELLSPLTP